MASARVNFSSGSSPLTRGKLATLGYSTAWRGLIPAHAGKTRRFPTPSPWLWAHPRSRGENSDDTAARQPNEGSSPLTRGKHVECEQIPRLQGPIPAHAGKTCRSRQVQPGVSAHPRSRGENGGDTGKTNTTDGSSPLTRGKCSLTPRPNLLRGLIPAHTGRTCVRYAGCRCSRAHPRSCGENRIEVTDIPALSGSSPLMRGKR